MAAAAAGAGLPYTLSTYATTSITDLAQAAPGGRNWFQLYLMKDRAVSIAHLGEAAEQGYEAIVLTMDTTVTGLKRKDKRNGFAIPPQLTRSHNCGHGAPPGLGREHPDDRAAAVRDLPRRVDVHAVGGCPTSCASRRSGPPTSPG